MGSDESAVESPTPNSGADRESVVMIVKDLIDDLRGGGVGGQASRGTGGKGTSTLQRYRSAISKTAPRVNTSVKLMSADLVHWMNCGGPWRAFLILSVRVLSLSLSSLLLFSSLRNRKGSSLLKFTLSSAFFPIDSCCLCLGLDEAAIASRLSLCIGRFDLVHSFNCESSGFSHFVLFSLPWRRTCI